MPGPIPKNPQVRQRQNKAATQAKLEVVEEARTRAPKLPRRDDGKKWHPMTRAWWRDVWHSPMAAEYLESDKHALFRLAMLVDKFWHSPSKDLAAEIRLQQQCFGLSPIDRRRLQWEIERVNSAGRRKPERAVQPVDDPRAALAGALRRRAPREDHVAASDERAARRQQRPRRLGQEARGHAQDGRGQQGIRPLSLVIVPELGTTATTSVQGK